MSGAIVPILAAAAKRKREIQEEELMTGYNKEDMRGWEFKIVRSTFGSFRNPEKVRKLCEDEAAAGWEMLEKFDDYRIRFKRRVEKRSMDPHLNQDPYRSAAGAGSSNIILLLLALSIFLVGLGIFLVTANQ
ncbi:MAG: hypothetical protein ACOYVF_12990 [Candidatus Zixiibacteriota bacterium]